jgi:hypothetical protein
LRLITLQALFQLLATLTRAQVLGVVFTQLRDSPVFTPLLRLSVSESARDKAPITKSRITFMSVSFCCWWRND